MRKLELLCVGKIKESYYRGGIAEYLKRLGRFCDASVVEIPDLADDVGAAEKESKALLSRMDGFVILSDLRGKLLTSEELAATLERGYLRAPKVQFIIGGSRGVTDEVRKAADAVVSFGRMTYPHRLMRLIAAEQLYRAFTISENVQYHK